MMLKSDTQEYDSGIMPDSGSPNAMYSRPQAAPATTNGSTQMTSNDYAAGYRHPHLRRYWLSTVWCPETCAVVLRQHA
jgi:hypothetical protein